MKILKEYLKILEYRDLGKTWKKWLWKEYHYYEEDFQIEHLHFDDKIDQKDLYKNHHSATERWVQDMKRAIPNDFVFHALPMKFSYTDSIQIK